MLALERAWLEAASSENSGIHVECLFYAFIHRAEKQTETLRHLKWLLVGGARSPGWNLRPHVQIAVEDHHIDSEWVERLAAVISEGADIHTLDGWRKWNEL
jgi:hypothetical protein